MSGSSRVFDARMAWSKKEVGESSPRSLYNATMGDTADVDEEHDASLLSVTREDEEGNEPAQKWECECECECE